MKYLHQDKLSHWTAALTGVTVGHSRVLNGRVEVYSMKRAGSDKKYAAVLGEKYVERIHQDQEMAAAAAIKSEEPSPPRKRSLSTSILQETEKDTDSSLNKRRRSRSFDQAMALFPTKQPTALGDFTQQATRRLMTDLILTLNASFPDYDFGSIKASDFTKVKVASSMSTINNRLSEWARSEHSGAGENVLQELWKAVNESIALPECDVYSFQPPDGSLMSTLEDEDDEDENTASTNLWSFYYLFVDRAQKRILLFTATESMQATTVAEDDEAVEERFIGVTDFEHDDRFDLDPAASPPGGIPVSPI